LDGPGKLERVKQLTESLPPLKKILRVRGSVWDRYGRSEDEKRSSEERIVREYDRYVGLLGGVRRIVEAEGNVTVRRLNREFSIGRRSVERLLDGGEPEFIRYMPGGFAINVPFTEDADFAFMLGRESGKVTPCFPTDIYCKSRDRETVERVRGVVARVRGKENAIQKEGGFYIFNIPCPEMVRYIKDETDSQGRIPWEHVKSMGERIAFLQGYFSGRMGEMHVGTRGGLVSPHFRVAKDIPGVPEGEKPSLFVDMQILLMKVGVQSTVWKAGELSRKAGELPKYPDRWYLDINELSSLKRVLSLKLLPDSKHDRLKSLFDKALNRRGEPGLGRMMGSYTPEQYDAVMEYAEEHRRFIQEPKSAGWKSPRAFYVHVADEVNRKLRAKVAGGSLIITHDVNIDLARLWLSGLRKPLSAVKRDATAGKERELYGSVDDFLRVPWKLMKAAERVERRFWSQYDYGSETMLLEDLEAVAEAVCKRTQGTEQQFLTHFHTLLKRHMVEKDAADDPEVQMLLYGIEERLEHTGVR